MTQRSSAQEKQSVCQELLINEAVTVKPRTFVKHSTCLILKSMLILLLLLCVGCFGKVKVKKKSKEQGLKVDL